MNGPFLSNVVPVYSNTLLTVKLASQLYEQIFVTFLGALLGGLSAAFFTNYFESKGRVEQMRLDKYSDHRYTIVQIEQEVISIRLNLSRDIVSIKEALNNSNNLRVRLLLRLYKLSMSSGSGLKLLNLDLINEYFDVFTKIESVNSDFEYIAGLVDQIRPEVVNKGKIAPGLVETYLKILSLVDQKCAELDKVTLELLALCKKSFKSDVEKERKEYVKKGGEIKYSFNNESLEEIMKKVVSEESDVRPNVAQPQFFAPYLDCVLI